VTPITIPAHSNGGNLIPICPAIAAAEQKITTAESDARWIAIDFVSAVETAVSLLVVGYILRIGEWYQQGRP
jgi:hypothetical protein